MSSRPRWRRRPRWGASASRGCRPVVASLLSEDNPWVNAQTIEVAGGYVI